MQSGKCYQQIVDRFEDGIKISKVGCCTSFTILVIVERQLEGKDDQVDRKNQ